MPQGRGTGLPRGIVGETSQGSPPIPPEFHPPGTCDPVLRLTPLEPDQPGATSSQISSCSKTVYPKRQRAYCRLEPQVLSSFAHYNRSAHRALTPGLVGLVAAAKKPNSSNTANHSCTRSLPPRTRHMKFHGHWKLLGRVAALLVARLILEFSRN